VLPLWSLVQCKHLAIFEQRERRKQPLQRLGVGMK
jgi:hypothetical protein